MTIRLHSMVLLPVLFGCVAQGHAQSPESLSVLVAQLQKTPQDDALREKVIRLARATTPEPAVPPEALRHEKTGNTLFKNAKTRQDYLVAAHEYDQALRHAPWAARLYFGLGEVHETMADTGAGDRQSRAQIKQSCSNEARKEEWQRFDGYEQARKL